ncbi:hypothetical protein Rhopal_004022-T1 [Rhodotorula paludigena]|uniref:Proteophosphoglycan ppg4 n=1 Tax=Rhodotorula paludigena TaxID=86838 RepID=A0AAV5GLC9_9BASI|nr:hypothetical protein Rhopal_004022-T1 [Rhodotorula paludigena]
MSSYPYFDPADFASPSSVSPSASTSSELSATQTWTDAHSSPYSSSHTLARQASSSQSSLWTASSVSDAEEQRCLDLLDQLETEVTKLAVEDHRRARFQHHQASSSVRTVEGLFGGPASLDASPVAGPSNHRRTRPALGPSQSNATLRASSSHQIATPSRRRSRRLSFTKTDLADLDIDAILDAYTIDGTLPSIETTPAPAPRSVGPARPTRSPLRTVHSSVHLRQRDVETAPPLPIDAAELPSLYRTSTNTSSRSVASAVSVSAASVRTTASTPYDDMFPHRRVSPFPTIQRRKSAASIASSFRRPNLADAPPLPPLPALPLVASSPSVPSNRTFSSFARQSTSASSTFSFPGSPSSSARSQPMRGTRSRDSHYSTTSSSAASSAGNSFRWSVATSSTAPSDYGSSVCGDGLSSRRGSASTAAGGASPSLRGNKPRFSPPREESEEEDDDLPVSRRRGAAKFAPVKKTLVPSKAELDSSDDEPGRHEGLISWEDFAHELEAIPPPPSAAAAQQHRSAPKVVFRDATPTRPPKEREGVKAQMRRKISLATLKVR